MEFDPQNEELWVDFANLLIQQKEYTAAIDLMLMGLKNLPDSAEINYKLGISYYLSGDTFNAQEYVRNGLQLNYDGHDMIFETLPVLANDPSIIDLINSHK